MTLTPHALVGAVLANIFPYDPALGFSLAFASHYALDSIPHWEYPLDGFIDEDKKEAKSIFHNIRSVFKPLAFIGTDFILAITLSYFIFVHDERSLFLTAGGAFLAMLPDFLQFVYFKFKNSFWTKVQSVHEFFHGYNKYKHDLIKGNLTQIFTVAVFLSLYFLH